MSIKMPRMQRSSLTLFIGCAIVLWLLVIVGYPKYWYDRRLYSFWHSDGVYATDESNNYYTMPWRTDTRNFSILGKWLRAHEGTKPPSSNKAPPGQRYKILIWKHGNFLHRRHVRHFDTNNSTYSPWLGCSVDDCDLSYRDEDLAIADAVIFHLHMTKGRGELPAVKGKAGQIWIFLSDEAPFHTFMYAAENRDVAQYDNTFDWSMTYREGSDVPVAYGRTIARRRGVNTEKEDRHRRRKLKTKMVAIMGSNCHSKNNERWKYAEKLKALLEDRMDVYGGCLGGNRTACPGHFRRDCPILVNYKFYLAFENSNCREYMTEKLFWNAYGKESVPIIMGAPRTDCQRLLPPHSYIHIDDFASPESLVMYLRYLDEHYDAYDKYHEWRSSYMVVNEHGYFGSRSVHYCRVCEALHYNTRPSPIPKYRRLGDFFNSDRDCYPYKL